MWKVSTDTEWLKNNAILIKALKFEDFSVFFSIHLSSQNQSQNLYSNL